MYYNMSGKGIFALGAPGAFTETFSQALAVAPCGYAWFGGGVAVGGPTINLSTFGSSFSIALAKASVAFTSNNAELKNRIAADDVAIYWTDASGAIGRLPL
jgi:hypothetical protein